MWVLENSSANPFEGEWIDKGKLSLPDDKWAIDGTLAMIDGESYFAWSGWESDENVRQDLYLVKMEDPLTPTGDRIKISSPELPWELAGGTPTVNEAPQFLLHDDMVFITFSASGCWTDDYAIGLLSASAENPLSGEAWVKSEQPLLTKNASSLAYGPGHNAFFKSKDGTEDWVTYHANANAGAGCGNMRSMRMQKFSWQNGKPFFGPPAAVGAAMKVPSGEN
jgi:GH43 family beta-xylosidase